MTAREFCFWLQGYMEITEGTTGIQLNPRQVQCIQKHLAMVFQHEIDPGMGDEQHQSALNHLHDSKTYPEGYKPRC